MCNSWELISAATNARAFRAIKPAEIRAERFSFKVGEFRELIQEGEIDSVSRAVALFGHNQFRDVLVFVAAVVNFFPVDESDQIGILLDGSRFAQVRQLRPMI